jgi:hypothetical protein
MSEHIGPSLWHGREVNSCVRCKYLRCRLVKSGKRPDYDYFCMHPIALSGELQLARASILEKVKELRPDMLAKWTEKIETEKAEIAERGEFISNDSYTPETPNWCPVTTSKS